MDSSKTAVTSTISSLPPYKAPSPPSPSQFKSQFIDFNDDSHSEISRYTAGATYSYSNDVKPAPSLTDLSSPSPSTSAASVSTTTPRDNQDDISLSPLSPP